MTKQLSMFDAPLIGGQLTEHDRARQAKAVARVSDPESSHEAAARMRGVAAKAQEDRIADLVFERPGLTTHELAALSAERHGEQALDHVQIGKRTPHMTELQAGEIRKCSVSGRRCQTWWPRD